MIRAIHSCGPGHIPFCKLFEMCDGYFVKIGEMNGDSSIVCIGGDVPLLLIQPKIWLETITRYASVLYDNFRVIEDLTRELEKLGSSQQIIPYGCRDSCFIYPKMSGSDCPRTFTMPRFRNRLYGTGN